MSYYATAYPAKDYRIIIEILGSVILAFDFCFSQTQSCNGDSPTVPMYSKQTRFTRGVFHSQDLGRLDGDSDVDPILFSPVTFSNLQM